MNLPINNDQLDRILEILHQHLERGEGVKMGDEYIYDLLDDMYYEPFNPEDYNEDNQ